MAGRKVSIVFAEWGKKVSEWFHGECVRVTEQDADQIEDHFCDTCSEAAVEP